MVYFSVLTLILKFLLHGLLFCADSYFGIRSTAVLPQWHVKDPGLSAKSASGMLQLNIPAPYILCDFERSDTVDLVGSVRCV